MAVAVPCVRLGGLRYAQSLHGALIGTVASKSIRRPLPKAIARSFQHDASKHPKSQPIPDFAFAFE